MDRYELYRYQLPQFIVWWLVDGPGKIFAAWGNLYVKVWHLFSVPFMLQTLFYPWKKDLISDSNLSLNDRFRVWALNLASRAIGFLMRVMAVIAWGIFEAAVTFGMVCFLVFWFTFPAISIYLIYWGLKQ